MYAVAFFIATSSEPNVLVSHVFYFFDIQYMGALLTKITKPVLDLLVIVSPA